MDLDLYHGRTLMGFWSHMNIRIISRDSVCWQENIGVPIYATAGTIRAMEDYAAALGKLPEGIFHESTCRIRICPIGDLTVHPFRISHDAAEPVAYRIGAGKTVQSGSLPIWEFIR